MFKVEPYNCVFQLESVPSSVPTLNYPKKIAFYKSVYIIVKNNCPVKLIYSIYVN